MARQGGLCVALALCVFVCAAPVAAFKGGAVFVTSTPTGVEVLLDGKSIGKTPATVTGVAPGPHVLEVVSDKWVYPEAVPTIEVQEGQLATFHFNLVPASEAVRNQVTIYTDFVGLEIYIDGERVGTVQEGVGFTQPDLAKGAHIVTIRGPHVKVTKFFEIRGDAPTEIEIPSSEYAGTLVIDSDLEVSGVTLDGKPISGTLPVEVPFVQSGRHVIVLQAKPLPIRREVEVSAGEVCEVSIMRDTDTSPLHIVTDPPGLSLRVDGLWLDRPSPVTLYDVGAGEHVVEAIGPEGRFDYGVTRVYVPGGGEPALATIGGKKLRSHVPRCPPDMVLIEPGAIDALFWNPDPAAEAAVKAAIREGFFREEIEDFVHGFDTPPQNILDLSSRYASLSIAWLRLAGAGLSEFVRAHEELRKRYSNVLQLPGGGVEPTFRVVERAFCIDKYEYPNKKGALPQEATFYEAMIKCAEQGKRLCTAEEWVLACVGKNVTVYPYGNAFDPTACNTLHNKEAGDGVVPSGSMPRCVNDYGLYDMSGNLEEWVIAATIMPDLPGSTDGSLVFNQRVAEFDFAGMPFPDAPPELRGGGWYSGAEEASCRYLRTGSLPETSEASWPGHGFRCCSF